MRSIRFRILATTLLLLIVSLLHATKIFAIDPAEPTTDEFYKSFFPLYRFIKPTNLIVFENQDRNRRYPPLHICHDQRAKTCQSETDCTGPVDLCTNNTDNTARSDVMGGRHGQCVKVIPKEYDANGKLIPVDPASIEGKCKYTGIPTSSDAVQSTDFSNPTGPDSSSTSSTTPTDSLGNVLVYPKLQNEAYRYDYNSSSDNVITNGMLDLSLTMCDRLVRQAIVVKQAAFTKDTLAGTGEWPLGWVNWNFQTPNGKTLIEIARELPGNVGGDAYGITYAHEQFLTTLGGENIDTSAAEKDLCNTYYENPTATWAVDLSQAPMYPPSNERGYTRKSVCLWAWCCPGLKCPFPYFAKSKALYTDPTVHQAWAAAMDDLFTTFPLDQAMKIFQDIVVKNPLARYFLSTLPAGIPSKITAKLDVELHDNVVKCGDATKPVTFHYVADNYNPLTLNKLGFIYDYQDSMDSDCYKIQPADVTKESGGAYTTSNIIQDFLNAIYPRPTDMVDMVTFHYLSIPDLMGQSLADLQQMVYNTRDTEPTLTQAAEHNSNMSNTVNDQGVFPYAGKPMSIANSQRAVGLFTCSDPDYSAPLSTSIEAYALGTRIGCQQATTTAGLCDGTKFAALIKDSSWQAPLLEATNVVKNSAMFVDGKLNPKLESAYAAAEQATGIPCEVIAGIHFEEGSSAFTDGGDPTTVSVQNGGAASRDGGLETSAINAGKTLLNHPHSNTQELIGDISDFNGGGNSNCQLGYPFPIPFSGCPRQFIGDDDPYATNMLDARHTDMYLLYHGDLTAGQPTPYGNDRPGAFAVALAVYNLATSQNASAAASAAPTPTLSPRGTINPHGRCGENAIDTALGCIPIGSSLTTVLLTFAGGIAGAIALIVMFVGTVQIMTAGGDQEKIKKGRELFTAAVTGLLFLIFAGVLLRIVAGSIIKLPGF